MKFEQPYEGQPIVRVAQPAKTATDAQVRQLDLSDNYLDLLEHGGHEVKWNAADGRRYIEDLECPSCEESWSSLGDCPAMEFRTPATGYVSFPSNPRTGICCLCGHVDSSSALFRRVFPKQRQAALDEHFRSTRIPNKDLAAVRCNGKVCVGDKSFQSAAKVVCPDNPNLDEDFEACRIEAVSLDVAIQAVADEKFPDVWELVPLTPELWPRERWHNQPMTMTDAAPIREHQRKARIERARKLDAEAKEYRTALEATRV